MTVHLHELERRRRTEAAYRVLIWIGEDTYGHWQPVNEVLSEVSGEFLSSSIPDHALLEFFLETEDLVGGLYRVEGPGGRAQALYPAALAA